MTSAAKTSLRPAAMCAPFCANAASGKPALRPAPGSITTSNPALVNGGIDAGTSATRRSPGCCSDGTPIFIREILIDHAGCESSRTFAVFVEFRELRELRGSSWSSWTFVLLPETGFAECQVEGTHPQFRLQFHRHAARRVADPQMD